MFEMIDSKIRFTASTTLDVSQDISCVCKEKVFYDVMHTYYLHYVKNHLTAFQEISCPNCNYIIMFSIPEFFTYICCSCGVNIEMDDTYIKIGKN